MVDSIQQSPLQLGLGKIVISIDRYSVDPPVVVVAAAAVNDVLKAIGIAALDLDWYQPAVGELVGSLSGSILLMVVEAMAAVTPAVNDEVE